MKTYENLYPQIYNFESLYTAYRKARKGKRSWVEVAAVVALGGVCTVQLEAALLQSARTSARLELRRNRNCTTIQESKTSDKGSGKMVVSNNLIEQITAQAAQLPFSERLRLIHRIIDTLPLPQEPEQPQLLLYGQFRGAQMSTEEDFRLAEWRPTERELNGA